MVESQDVRLEGLLRETLQRDVDSLPFRVRPEDVLGRARERRIARSRSTIRWLVLAAALLVPMALALSTAQQRQTQEVLAEPRSHHAATLLADGRVLVTGGIGNEGVLDSAEVYDPRTSEWTATGSMSEARAQHTATRLDDGRVLVVGGSRAEIYDPATETFSVIGTAAGSPGRYGHAATLLPDGRVLILGGNVEPAGELPGVAVFDPATGEFERRPSPDPLLDRVWSTLVPLDDGTVLAVGGRDPSRFRHRSAPVIYDPATNTLAALQTIPAGKWTWPSVSTAVSATRLQDGRVLMSFPVDDSVGTTSLLIYDPVTGALQFAAELAGTQRSIPGPGPVTLADGRVLILLNGLDSVVDPASDQPPLDQAYLFDPSTNEVTVATSSSRLEQSTVTALDAGGALLVGGVDHAVGVSSERVIRVE